MPVITGAGRTTPGAGWTNYEAEASGVYIDIDTSSSEFPGTPSYVASLGAIGRGHWTIIGTSSVYFETATSFRIYIRYSNPDRILRVNEAQGRGFYINWIGVIVTL